MMDAKVAEAISLLVNKKISNGGVNIRIGTWLAAEETDENLSQVQVGSQIYRFVPKFNNVFLEGGIAGATVMLLGGQGIPFVIIGWIIGNIGAASDGSASPVA